MAALRCNFIGVPLYRWLILLSIGAALLAVSLIVRDRLAIDWTVQSVRAFVDGLGVWGPLAYMGILTFRFVFLIPTGLLLLVAGIAFGPLWGTVFAGLGMTGSGLLKFGFAAVVGREALLRQLPSRLQDWTRQMAMQKMSVLALGGVCAYPFFPKHVFQFAAILSGMGIAVYFAAVLAGSFIRAAIFSNIGEAIYSGAGLISATAILLAGLILPLCVRPWRRWMLGPLRAQTSPHTSEQTT